MAILRAWDQNSGNYLDPYPKAKNRPKALLWAQKPKNMRPQSLRRKVHSGPLKYICIYIYIYRHPPTTRTPLRNTVNTDANAVFSESNFGAVSTDWKHKCKTQKIQKPKNNQKQPKPKIQKFKNPKMIARFRRCKKFWISGFVDF